MSFLAAFLHEFKFAVHLLLQVARHFAMSKGACFPWENSNAHISSNRTNPSFNGLLQVRIAFPAI